MGRLRKPGRQLHALFALLFILANFASPAALSANQDPPAQTDLLVTAFTCLVDPGNKTVTGGGLPADCTPEAGVSMSITSDIDGDKSGTTLETGGFQTTVTVGATVTVRQDQTLLSGTQPRMNPITVSVLGPTEITFVSLPLVTVPPDDSAAPQQTDTSQESSRTMQIASEGNESLDNTQLDSTESNESTTGEESKTTNDTSGEGTTGETSDEGTTGGSSNEGTTSDQSTGDQTTGEEQTTGDQTTGDQPTGDPSNEDTSPEPAPVTTTYATVRDTGGAGLRCRAEANTSSTIITVLAEGTKVETRGAESGGWIPVKCSGSDGWIYAGYALTSTETTTPTSPTSPSGTIGTATVTNTNGSGLRCRASASTTSAIITVLAEGTKVETRGSASNGWLPVKCAGVDGWLYASYTTVNTTANPTPSPVPTTPPVSGTSGSGTVRNTGGGGLNCRTSASTSSPVITILAEGSTVETRGAAVGDWVPVKCAGQSGWVFSSYFVLSTSGGAPTPTPTPAPAPSQGTGKYAMVSGTGYGGLNCRTSGSLSASVITILPEGTSVETRGDVSNGWLPVKCAGQSGWVSASYVLLGAGSGSTTGAVWIEVDLTRQYMRVYRGSTVIGETYVSTGRYGFDTPPGTFYINWKLPSQTMTGVLGGEYYYVEDVPWVMYFTNRGHAIHGAYWHNNFGYRMSHGCVNLPISFSKWLYDISPVGTKVWIHY